MYMSHLSNVRYGYFDAMRGVSIILVVMHHVMIFSFGINSAIDLFIRTFMLPLFFFVSAFFAFKPLEAWNYKRANNLVFRSLKYRYSGHAFS